MCGFTKTYMDVARGKASSGILIGGRVYVDGYACGEL